MLGYKEVIVYNKVPHANFIILNFYTKGWFFDKWLQIFHSFKQDG